MCFDVQMFVEESLVHSVKWKNWQEKSDSENINTNPNFKKAMMGKRGWFKVQWSISYICPGKIFPE